MLWKQILRLGSKEMLLNQVKKIFASRTQILLPKRFPVYPPKETCLERKFPSLASPTGSLSFSFAFPIQVTRTPNGHLNPAILTHPTTRLTTASGTQHMNP